MTQRQAEIIGLIQREVKPALGCTEPIAVALAVARAAEIIGEKCSECRHPDWRLKADFSISAEVSGNILKNGMGVSALGAACGKSEYGLEVLHDLCPEAIARAKELVDDKKVNITVADTCHKLYVKATVTVSSPDTSDISASGAPGERHSATAVIEDDHDHIVETWFDGRMLQSSRRKTDAPDEIPAEGITGKDIPIQEIYDFATHAAFDDIKFILESRTLNLALAEEGMHGDYGLKVGKTIGNSRYDEVFGKDFMSYAMSLTAAASDARMAGCTLPAMSNSGSGNQGITATMPVIAYAIKYGTDDETLARALILSHLVAIHIKGYLGKLSALCGCVIASTGSACGITWLRGGSYAQICAAIKNMIGNITGMVCDGAKVGCALKVASGVAGAIQSAVLAMEGSCISEHDGIIEKDIEKTIMNLGQIGSVGMQNTDNMILDIMVCK